MAFLLLGGVFFLGQQPYQPPQQPEIRKRVHYLERVIQAGLEPETALTALYEQNPEWALFTVSFSGYAFTHLAQQDTAFRAEAAHYLTLGIEEVLKEQFRQSFALEHVAPANQVDTAGSVLYLGHLNLLLGSLRQLQPANAYTKLHDQLTGALYRRYLCEPSGCLESYAGLRWVPDNTVALASLALHSQLTGSPYAAAAQQWVARARGQYLDSTTGVLASRVDAQGRPEEEARGSMGGWSIWFLARFAPDFAQAQYQAYQQHFGTSLGVWQLYRERAEQYTTSYGDLDSGPLLLGYSIPATTFAFADAVALHDLPNARRLRRLIGLGSREIETAEEIHYTVRLANLSVSPLAEALLLYAEAPAPGSASEQ